MSLLSVEGMNVECTNLDQNKPNQRRLQWKHNV
ncbi:hypothetical protein CEXT_787811, partial [Caerostris extrusa]